MTGTVPLPPQTSSELHNTFAHIDNALGRYHPLNLHREGLSLGFTFGFLRAAPTNNPLQGIDAGRIEVTATPTGQAVSYELRLRGLAFLSLLWFGGFQLFVWLGPGPLRQRLEIGLGMPLAFSAIAYLTAILRFRVFLRRVVGGPSNKRLEPPRREGIEMGHSSSAPRGSGAVR